LSRFVETKIPGVIVVEPSVHRDERGFFFESYHAPRYREGGIHAHFVQDNHSRSSRDTLRGLHGQNPHAQGKLCRVVAGEVFDVAVDARKASPTYAQHFATTLSAENFRQIYIPPGVIHGFLVTSDFAEFEYKCTDLYHPEAEFSVAWDDPDIAIRWPIDAPILSEKDRSAPRLREVEKRLLDFEPEGGR
jgi:dTDP-4-dehydrorhamnose 3,5-epimerase